ncbi:MAG: hypothetical protein DME60_06505 [Verrucomicrobia bacterium]|nr:MAG: hypothetical protein DME60_06505 [Verrucomicrobiota bacterium]
MYAFDALTGATLWVGAQQPNYFLNSAAVDQGLVFATSLLGPLIAYDADTGEIVWTSSLASLARAAPVLKGRVLYVAGSELCCGFRRAALCARCHHRHCALVDSRRVYHLQSGTDRGRRSRFSDANPLPRDGVRCENWRRTLGTAV